VSDSTDTVLQIRRLGNRCLSYLVGSGAEAVVIDAASDPEIYLELARQRRWTITHVPDTQFHADHLSRTRPLAGLTGATPHLPAQDRVSFPFTALVEGDNIAFGDATLTALATAGHTMEPMC